MRRVAGAPRKPEGELKSGHLTHRPGSCRCGIHAGRLSIRLRPVLEMVHGARAVEPDLVWVLNSPEVYLLRVRELQQSEGDYQRWLAATLGLCLCG